MKKFALTLFLIVGMVFVLIGCAESDDDFDPYEYNGDEKIEVQQDDNDRVIYIEEDDEEEFEYEDD